MSRRVSAASKNGLFDAIEQSTCDTCLPVCLIVLLRKRGLAVKKSEEMNILNKGLVFTKLDYSIGQLVYACAKYGVEMEMYVEHPAFHRTLSGLGRPKNLKLMCEKIDKKFMRQMSGLSPVVVYLDKYYLDGVCHYPHFVILVESNCDYSLIFDPWDGHEKKIDAKLLVRSVQSLRNRLKMSPKLIRIV